MLVVEQLYLMRTVEIVLDRVGVVGEACQKILVYWLLLSDSFNEDRDYVMILVMPWLLIAKMAV